MNTVAIIGGGFSGTMVAVNLARLSERPLRIVIINSKRPLGRGTAYGTSRSEHVLNVAARNMSALPDFPTHFLDWLRSRSEYSDRAEGELRELFAPRRVYGDYLRGLLAAYENPIDSRCQVQIETIEDEAIDVKIDGRARVILKSGLEIEAERVVLATGNQPPRLFPSSSPLRHDPRYRSDPWSDWLSRLPAPGGKIVLLGTGLTMIDIVLTLREIGWDGQIVAVSRGGRLPQSHFRGIAYDDFLPEDTQTLGLNGLRSLVQKHCDRLRQMSQNPAIVVDKLRPHTQKIWRSLTGDEKREFLSKNASEWNVLRHRIAASVHSKVTDALDSGRLQIVAGTVERLVPGEQEIEILMRDSSGAEFTQAGDLVINCTGPMAELSETASPLFSNLLSRGLVQSDELDMGVRADDEFAIINSVGDAVGVMYAIGPLLKGELWETTAVPELRGQALRLAETLLHREPRQIVEAEVIEYYI
ncbi:MAG: FAD/NAD(P)-binding protein [Rubripirellula sp.]|nr:FAD/NAD(P)-binding protein [Rubripirellula sp.]